MAIRSYDFVSGVESEITIENWSIDDLEDVTITTPSDDQFLRHNGTNWVNETVTLSTDLANLTDVTITTPSNDQNLTYNSTTGKWENKTYALPLTITSGTYTPTASETVGMGTPYSLAASYIRVGNIVTVTGTLWTYTPFNWGGKFELSLPVARSGNFSSTTQAWGHMVGVSLSSTGAALSAASAVSGTQRIRFDLNQESASYIETFCSFTFNYTLS
jgi:hypothetical protein